MSVLNARARAKPETDAIELAWLAMLANGER